MSIHEECGVIGIISSGAAGYCCACFDGNYPTAIPFDTRKDRFEQKLSEKRKG